MFSLKGAFSVKQALHKESRTTGRAGFQMVRSFRRSRSHDLLESKCLVTVSLRENRDADTLGHTGEFAIFVISDTVKMRGI